MAELKLKAAPREVLGKRVRGLRKGGLLPGNLYGQGLDSQALQMPAHEVSALFRKGGRTGLIDLSIDGQSEERPVVVRAVQRSPVTREILHVDFMQVSLTEKISTTVRLVFVGESPAVKTHGGVFVQSLDQVQISALPTNLPQSIEVDLGTLTELEQALHVRDLKVPPEVTITLDPETLVAKVGAPKLRAEVEAEEAELAAELAEEEATEAAAEADAGEGDDEE